MYTQQSPSILQPVSLFADSSQFEVTTVATQLGVNQSLECFSDLSAALSASLVAGAILQQGYGVAHRIEEKGIGDLVSVIDRNAETAVIRHLSEFSSCKRFISEEFTINEALTDDATWIIDPLDGSGAYLYQSHPKDVSVMIALMQNKETVLSVVYRPLIDEMWYAVKGNGSFCNGQLITVEGNEQSLDKSRLILNQYGDVALESEFFSTLRNKLRTPGVSRIHEVPLPASGFALDVLKAPHLYGAAIHDNNPAKVKQEMWDTIPIQLIVEEAGGTFIGAESGERYHHEHPEPIVIAPSRELAETIRAL